MEKIKDKKSLSVKPSKNKKKPNVDELNVLLDAEAVDLTPLEKLEQEVGSQPESANDENVEVKETKKRGRKKKEVAAESDTEKVATEEEKKEDKAEVEESAEEDKEKEGKENKKEKPKKKVKEPIPGDIDAKPWKILFFVTLGVVGVFLILLIILIVMLNTPPTNIF